MRKKFIYVLWALVACVILAIAFIFTAIAKGWIGYVPPIEELENPNLKFATEIISDDGKMLGTWSISKENRVFVGYDQLSPTVNNLTDHFTFGTPLIFYHIYLKSFSSSSS